MKQNEHKIGTVVFYILAIIIVYFSMREALWEHKLDVEYKQQILQSQGVNNE